MKHINPKYTQPEAIKKIAQSFRAAKPYPYIMLDNFLTEDFAASLHDNFPTPESLDIHYKGLNEKKSEGADFTKFHPSFMEMKQLQNSPEFTHWMEQVTGIDGLFITDDNMGMGIHQGSKGSFLDIHVDFNIHPTKNVHRRLNMLVYLNKDWQDEYKGHFELLER